MSRKSKNKYPACQGKYVEPVYKYVKAGLELVPDMTYGAKVAPFMPLVEKPEYWAGNYGENEDEVLVRMAGYYDGSPRYRVCVSGNDDTYVCKDFEGPGAKEEMEWTYHAIGDGITKAALHDFGFRYD
jgi:hypothetical protein